MGELAANSKNPKNGLSTSYHIVIESSIAKAQKQEIFFAITSWIINELWFLSPLLKCWPPL